MTTQEPRHMLDRRLWSRVAAWLLLVVLAVGGTNLWVLTIHVLDLRRAIKAAVTRGNDFEQFRADLQRQFKASDESDRRSAAEVTKMQIGLAELRKRVRAIETVTPVVAIKDRAKGVN